MAAILAYQVSPRVSVGAGYRILDINYSEGAGANAFRYDVQMWRPLLGPDIHTFIAGLAISTAARALSDYGIDATFMRPLSGQMQTGSSAMFMLVRRVTTDKLSPKVAKVGSKLLYTLVSKEAEAKPHEMLDAPNQLPSSLVTSQQQLPCGASNKIPQLR